MSWANPPVGLASRLLEARKRRGLTQEMLASLLGTDNAFVRKCERSDRNLSCATLGRFAQALEVSADWLLGLKNEGLR